MSVKKILCCCMSGLGSSFMVEMNVKKVLEQLGLGDIEVTHSGINDVSPGIADLFVCSSDMEESCKAYGETIPLENLMSIDEIRSKLKAYFERKN